MKTVWSVNDFVQACFGEADGSTGAVSTCQGLLGIVRWPSDSTGAFHCGATECLKQGSLDLFLDLLSAKECSRALFYIWTEAHCGPAPQSH